MEDTLDAILAVALNVLASLSLLTGLFFMFVGALGVVRMPDFYHRSHAASKCITLGISGMLLALVLFMSAGVHLPTGQQQMHLEEELGAEVGVEAPVTAAVTKALLVLAFVFVSAPVGTHMVARAAHLAGVTTWGGTLSDELADDRAAEEQRGGESPTDP